MIDGTVLVNNYHAKNNSIGVMDSILMNMMAVKSGIGYDTDSEPVVGDNAYLVNGRGKISSLAGVPKMEISAIPGFEFSKPVPNIAVKKNLIANSEKAFHVGQVFYQPTYNEASLPTLLKNHRIAYPLS